MNPHKLIVTAAFVAAGMYYGFTVVRDFDSILATHRAFLDSAPAWQANLSTAVITLVPLAFFAVALAVYRDAKWWITLAPALIALIFTIGLSSIVLGAYLVLYYAALVRPEGSKHVGA